MCQFWLCLSISCWKPAVGHLGTAVHLKSLHAKVGGFRRSAPQGAASERKQWSAGATIRRWISRYRQEKRWSRGASVKPCRVYVDDPEACRARKRLDALSTSRRSGPPRLLTIVEERHGRHFTIIDGQPHVEKWHDLIATPPMPTPSSTASSIRSPDRAQRRNHAQRSKERPS
jgi:hypothetical protein